MNPDAREERLVEAKEGTFKVSRSMQRYIDKHLRRCLTKEERDALFKEHPRPDYDLMFAPQDGQVYDRVIYRSRQTPNIVTYDTEN